MGIWQTIKDIGSGIGDIIARMIEAHEKAMMTPTPCRQCQQEYLYKDLHPKFSTSFAQRSPFPYKQMWEGKTYLRHHSYCSTCWDVIFQELERQRKLAIHYKREAARVQTHNERALALGREATLTISQWIDTLNRLDWHCAYCGGPYEELEHWIPINLGGGTTAGNCIPSCESCNRRKGNRHPDDIMNKESSLSPEVHRRIKADLQKLHGNQSAVPRVTIKERQARRPEIEPS